MCFLMFWFSVFRGFKNTSPMPHGPMRREYREAMAAGAEALSGGGRGAEAAAGGGGTAALREAIFANVELAGIQVKLHGAAAF